MKSPDYTCLKATWHDCVKRVLIHVTNYLEFDGQYCAGGRPRHVRDLATIVRDMWQREVVIVQKGTHNFEKQCANGFHVIGIKSNLRGMGDPCFSYKFRRLFQHSDGVLYASGEVAWPFFVQGAKAIQHGIWWDGPEPAWIRLVQKQRVIAAMKAVRSMLCVDTNFINWLRAQSKTGFDLAKKCVYVPNYADISKLAVSREIKSLPIRLICARRYEEKRGINLFIDTLAVLERDNLPFTAHISTVGGIDEVRSRLSSYNLTSKVTVSEDDMDTVLTRYAKADVAVVPTIWSEGTSLACIEAICAGVPVVATPVGGLGNLVIPGFNGYLVDPSPHSIAYAIEELADLELLSAMRRNCLSLRNAFNIEVWQQRVLEWLKQ